MEISLNKALVDRFEEAVERRYKSDKETVRAMRTLLARYEQGDLAADLVGILGRQEEERQTPTQRTRKGRPGTLRSKVIEACESQPEKQWTTREMVAHLEGTGFPVSEQTARSVSACLWKLSREKKLLVVHQGTGSRPSVYRWKCEEGDPKGPEAAA
ncbi:MAG: hypothetical protein OXN89_20200 [Bryobacterales bacterium]|nr:hypothetical protein [Bryobacterales bacterium]